MRQTSIAIVLLFLLVTQSQAADRLATEQADKDRDVYKGLVVGKKFAGRLPNGYREVVSNSQREEIYKIQQDYFDMVELLKARLELLESEKNLKIDGLLTGEQRVKLKTILSSLESERNVRRGDRIPARSAQRNAPARSAPTPENTPAAEVPAEN